MVSNELGACEWFVWDLRRSGLIDRGQLDQIVGEFLRRNPRAEPPQLAEFLVSQNILSPYQAERILTGKTQGLVLGPYVLLDTIGSGSMGQVYKASSKTDNQWYAVKVLPRRSMWNVRLARRQVRAFSQFTHPAVVPFVDVGTSGGLHYLVWPLVEGETLEQKIDREKRMSAEAGARAALQIAQGLTACHQNGIFHGLLKPSNIMMGADGQAKILDFGIGSLLVENEGESLVDTMSTANTLTSGLDCSSPESIMEPTNRTPAGDQYALGCILYYCLAGHYPFPDGTAVEKMMAHQFKQPVSLNEVVPGLPKGLAEVVDRLMQKTPESRYSACDELVDVLQAFVPDSPRYSAPAVNLPASNNPTRYGVGAPTSAQINLSSSAGFTLPSSGQSSAYIRTQAGSPAPPAGPPQGPPGTRPTPSGLQSKTNVSAPAVHPPQAPRSTAVPSRSQFNASPPIPEATLVDDAPPPSASSPVVVAPPQPYPPNWDPDTRRTGAGPLFAMVMAVLVMALAFLIGKNFIFG